MRTTRIILQALRAGIIITTMHLQVIGEKLTSRRATKFWLAIGLVNTLGASVTTYIYDDYQVISAETAQYPMFIAAGISIFALFMLVACITQRQPLSA